MRSNLVRFLRGFTRFDLVILDIFMEKCPICGSELIDQKCPICDSEEDTSSDDTSTKETPSEESENPQE